jgi:hypothetical protein
MTTVAMLDNLAMLAMFKTHAPRIPFIYLKVAIFPALLPSPASTTIQRVRAVTCATPLTTQQRRERCEPERSEVQISPLLK